MRRCLALDTTVALRWYLWSAPTTFCLVALHAFAQHLEVLGILGCAEEVVFRSNSSIDGELFAID